MAKVEKQGFLGIRQNIRGTALEDKKRFLQGISPYGSFHARPELTPNSCARYSVPSSNDATLGYRGLPYDVLEDLLPTRVLTFLVSGKKQTLHHLLSRSVFTYQTAQTVRICGANFRRPLYEEYTAASSSIDVSDASSQEKAGQTSLLRPFSL